MQIRRLWLILFLVMAASFAVLGLMGREIHRQAPPTPEAVIAAGGDVLYSRQGIQNGQLAWQSMEVIHSPLMEMLVWLRMPGDVVFSIGALVLAVFAAKLVRRRRVTAGGMTPEALPAE